MVEFKGPLTGNAEKYFYKKNKKMSLVFFIFTILVGVVPILVFALTIKHWILLISSSIMIIAISGMIIILPMSKKEIANMFPKRIYTDEECIICVCEKSTESKFIGDEKCVKDFGEYYDIEYPIGKVSGKFICQKNLLTKGTLEEFEALFEGKIIKMEETD